MAYSSFLASKKDVCKKLVNDVISKVTLSNELLENIVSLKQ
jgi:hypothetical protein